MQKYWNFDKMIKETKITSMDLLVKLMTPALSDGNMVKFTVVGNSMYPIFRNGIENVVVKRPDKIKNFDVILYKRDSGEYVLHRIVGKGREGYKLCGDNQLIVEYPVKAESIIAVVTAFERDGRLVQKDVFWYRLYSVIWGRFIFLRPFMLKVMRIMPKKLLSKVTKIQ